jgi:hypothetical protein
MPTAPTGCSSRSKPARLDATYEQEMRRLIAVDLLILDLSRRRNYADDWVRRGARRQAM